jgi:hypothetical protein
LNWNLGEENTNTDLERIGFAEYIAELDPYDHPIVVHTFPGSDDAVYTPLLGNQSRLSGASLQGDWEDIHELTLEWVRKSKDAGKPWIICNDEQGPAFFGVPTDGYAGSHTQDDIRRSVLWGNLMAGGAGVEYFFGYALPHNDLTCEDFRSRDLMWDYNRIARHFFQDHLTFNSLESADSLVLPMEAGAYCMSSVGSDTIVVYLPTGGATQINLAHTSGIYHIDWFDPRTGGDLQKGSLVSAPAGAIHALGHPPDDPDADWVALLTRSEFPGQQEHIDCAPFTCDIAILWWNYADSISIDEIGIEWSNNGTAFTPVNSQPEVQCGTKCHAFVPLDGKTTFFRLRYAGGGYSNIVRCERTCDHEPENSSGEDEFKKSSRKND